MKHPEHKLVCWNDYAIPVPLWAKWMAIDQDGEFTIFKNKPEIDRHILEWINPDFADFEYLAFELKDLEPPEPGPWDEQIYWIGD